MIEERERGEDISVIRGSQSEGGDLRGKNETSFWLMGNIEPLFGMRQKRLY